MSLRISGSLDPRALPGFYDGYFFVQDEACAISVLALDPKKGEKIADVCSAPGGKSFAAAILSSDQSEIMSFDLHESKLSLIKDGAQRLGLTSVTVSSLDATTPNEELFGYFDKVICDVPCSGLGVLGKKADLKYRSEDALRELPNLQYEILSKSLCYLKDNGELIYSTCTLNPLENEEVIKRLIGTRPEISPIDFTVGDLSSHNGMLTLIPFADRTDGFFVAKLKKEKI
jgi:16S rRNA (cytosine967-C5)-methyltransferase